MTRYGDLLKLFRCATAWLCVLGLAWWMVVDAAHTTVPALIFMILFFLLSFNARIEQKAEIEIRPKKPGRTEGKDE